MTVTGEFGSEANSFLVDLVARWIGSLQLGFDRWEQRFIVDAEVEPNRSAVALREYEELECGRTLSRIVFDFPPCSKLPQTS
ncbi:hypothetical protein [Halomicrococcus sp. NG-SE-24]|uniref:hypothetical protein n=1 Tax=Halomicrococcus sp. NG-SE-24 TaxID=3436928 RepID=UPI003D96A335